MANALTGDFEAVLQVSVGTLRRLVAGMHQNANAQAGTPNLPHVAYLRLDDAELGQHGSVAAQIGVPVIQLIHGATDRFKVEVGIRARYEPDPGSLPIADVIHGAVHAEYRLRDIDARCRGWERAGDDYFWFRVVRESVRFEGTVYNDSGVFDLLTLLDEATVKAHIEKHLRVLLDTTFEPAPQKVGARFRRLKSLAAGAGPNDAAVAIPWRLSSATAAGSINSINERFLDGHDWGLAVSADYILSRVQPMLDPLVGTQINIHHESDAGIGGGLIVDYHVRVDSASPDWLGPVALPLMSAPAGVIRIRLAGVGWCSRLYRSGVFNVGSISARDLRLTFTIDQYVLLTFDESSGSLSLIAGGTPIVSLSGTFAGFVESFARGYIANQAKARLGGPLASAQAQLNSLSSPASRDALGKALRGLDAAANTRLTRAIFRSDGLVLCGAADLSYRHRPQVSFSKTPWNDGFDAIESWIPGGRVDAFTWTWRWFNSPVQDPPGGPGTISNVHTYQLRRPPAHTTRFGLTTARERPLPGLDGHGRVCLAISGVQIDPFTGALVPVRSVATCEQYGSEFRLPYEVGPYLRLHDPRVDIRHGHEIGVVRIGTPDARSSGNTLLVSMGRRWNAEAARVIQSALDACRREDAGLLVVVRFDDGAFADAAEIKEGLRALADGLPAPLLAVEDVREGWATALSLPGDARRPSWRLLNPAGLVAWAHDDEVSAELLARMLDTRLVGGTPPQLAPIQAELPIGKLFPIEIAVPHCPPMPLGSAGYAGSTVVFAHKDSAPGRAVLRRLRDAYDQLAEDERPVVAIVLEGANAQEAGAFEKDAGYDFPTFPDPRGELTRRAGIRMSPTTLTLDERRIVVGSEAGAPGTERDDTAAAESE